MDPVEDIGRLRRLIRFVHGIFRHLTPIADSQLRPRDAERVAPGREGLFAAALPDALAALDSVDAELATITDADDDRWKQLQAVGLSGNSLRLKEGVLARLIEAFRGSFFRILQWINSFLGSLGAVPTFGPACDLAKEYKEMMELFVRFLHRLPLPPKSIFDLR